jgi:hypothetical protein
MIFNANNSNFKSQRRPTNKLIWLGTATISTRGIIKTRIIKHDFLVF